MVIVLRSILIVYVVAWAVGLMACLRKREFCPIFSDARRTRRFWLATFILVNPLLTILYLIFGQLRSPQAKPVRAVRDFVVVIAIAGFFINIPGLTHFWMQPFLGRSASAGGPEAHLAAIESKTGTNTTTTSVGRDNCRLACRRIAAVIEGDHVLLHRVAASLVEQLKTIPAVETVELCNDGVLPVGGGRAPDIFVRLHLGSVRETPIPYSLGLKAQIGANVGPAPWQSIHSHYDRYLPPLFEFNLRMQSMHASTTTGYESARYSMAARNIAKDVGEQIAKTLGQWQDKYGLLPELPAEFYGAYVATELPEPLRKLEPELLGSYTGLFKHNETYLQFTVADEPAPAIEQLRDAMTASGWEELSSDWKSPNIELRLQKDNRRIRIFQVRRREPFSGTVVIVRSSDEKPTHLFGVTDVKFFSDDERKAALDGLLARPTSFDRLILFEPMFDERQEQRWLEILESRPSRDISMQIRLGEIYQQKGRSEQAMQTLRRARTLMWAARGDSTYKNRLKGLAKKLGDESLAEFVPTPQAFRDAGFVEIPPDGGPFDVELDLGCPAVLFWQDAERGPLTLTVTVVGTGNDRDPFSAQYVLRRSHMSKSGSQSGFASTAEDWQTLLHHAMEHTTVECDIRRISGEDRFKLRVTVKP